MTGFSGCRHLLTPLGAFWACGGLQMPLNVWSVTSSVLTSPLFPTGFAAPLLLFKIGLLSLTWARCYAEVLKGCSILCAPAAELHGVFHCCIPFSGHAASCRLHWGISLTPQTKRGLGPATQHLRSPKGRQHQPCSLYPSGEGTGELFRRDTGILLSCFDTSR